MRGADDISLGSLSEARQDLALATSTLLSVPASRRGRVQVLLSVLRFFLTQRRMDFHVVAEEAERLLARMESVDAARLGLGEDLRAVALISLGSAETWALRFEAAERHLEQGVDLARQIGRPYLEFTGLTLWAHGMLLFRPDRLRPQRCWRALELAERHGWGEEPIAGIVCTVLGSMILRQGQLDDAEPWLDRAERTLGAEVEPGAGMTLWYARAVLEMARGRPAQALAAFRIADELAAELVRPNTGVTSMRARMVQALIGAGHADRAAAILARLDADELATVEMHTATAALQLAQGDPQAAADVLAPVLDGSVPGTRTASMMTALLQETATRNELGDQAAAGRALERALDIAESTGMRLPFLRGPVPAQLDPHRTAHSALVSQIQELLAARGERLPTTGKERPAGIAPPRLIEPLTDSETRVLHYLPTHLTAQEIASELSVSVTTVRTHIHHLFLKLGVHRRHHAIERACDLGLLAPSLRSAPNEHVKQPAVWHLPALKKLF